MDPHVWFEWRFFSSYSTLSWVWTWKVFISIRNFAPYESSYRFHHHRIEINFLVRLSLYRVKYVILQMITFAADESKNLLWVAHIPCDHYVETMLGIAFVHWCINLVKTSDEYRVMLESRLVVAPIGVVAQLVEHFKGLMEQKRPEFSMFLNKGLLQGLLSYFILFWTEVHTPTSLAFSRTFNFPLTFLKI